MLSVLTANTGRRCVYQTHGFPSEGSLLFGVSMCYLTAVGSDTSEGHFQVNGFQLTIMGVFFSSKK